MKLRYTGSARRDGSFPAVKVGDDWVRPDENRVIDVPDDVGNYLLTLPNFEKARAAKAVEPVAAEPEAAPAADEPAEPADQETALIAEAKALGIKATRNWGVPKLKAAIAEAKGKAE